MQDDLEAELLESPEREGIGSSRAGRRDFGTCQVRCQSRLPSARDMDPGLFIGTSFISRVSALVFSE